MGTTKGKGWSRGRGWWASEGGLLCRAGWGLRQLSPGSSGTQGPQTDLQASILSEWGSHWLMREPTGSPSVECPAQLGPRLYHWSLQWSLLACTERTPPRASPTAV